ncbi:MAG: hypothetical protein ACOY94_10050 [Bacillota bacterium]
MLKNTFRKLIGILILLVFGVAVFQFIRQTGDNEHVLAAVASGMWLLAFFAAVIGLAWWVDRRMRRRGE